MSNQTHDQGSGTEGSERAELRSKATKKKRKPGSGRPKGSTKVLTAAKRKDSSGELVKVEKDAARQARIIKRQRADCERLAKVIGRATPGAEDPKDIGALARATNILHEMEHAAHDIGAKGAQIRAVIVIPAGPATMEAWAKEAAGVLGKAVTNPQELVSAQVYEDDVQGEAPPEPPEEEP